MHQLSSTIKTLIETTPGYSLEILCHDLGLGNDELLTPSEVTAILKVTKRTICRWQNEGKLKPKWLGCRQKRFRRSDINALISQS